MNQQLSEFLDRYKGESPNIISKFKKYRNAHLGSLGISLLLTIIILVLNEVIKYRPTELPYSRIILYLIPALFLTAWFMIYLGYRDIDMTYERVTTYEIAEAIKCYDNNDFDGVFEHIEALEDEVTYSSNDVFSEKKQLRISEYYERLNNSDDKQNTINDSFEKFATILVSDIVDENKLAEITSDLQDETGDEFQRNVFVDAIGRFDIGLWRSLTLLVAVASLLIYNFIGQQAGFYFAVITLTIMQIWRSGSD